MAKDSSTSIERGGIEMTKVKFKFNRQGSFAIIPTDECIWNAYERDDIDKEGQLTKKEWIEFVRLHHKYDTEGTVSYEWICEEFERYVDDWEEDKEQIKYLDSMEDDDDEEEEFK